MWSLENLERLHTLSNHIGKVNNCMGSYYTDSWRNPCKDRIQRLREMGGLVPCKGHQIKPHLKPSLLLKFQLHELMSTSWWFKSFQIRFWSFANRRISTVSATIRCSTERKHLWEKKITIVLGHTLPQWQQRARCWLTFSPSKKRSGRSYQWAHTATLPSFPTICDPDPQIKPEWKRGGISEYVYGVRGVSRHDSEFCNLYCQSNAIFICLYI